MKRPREGKMEEPHPRDGLITNNALSSSDNLTAPLRGSTRNKEEPDTVRPHEIRKPLTISTEMHGVGNPKEHTANPDHRNIPRGRTKINDNPTSYEQRRAETVTTSTEMHGVGNPKQHTANPDHRNTPRRHPKNNDNPTSYEPRRAETPTTSTRMHWVGKILTNNPQSGTKRHPLGPARQAQRCKRYANLTADSRLPLRPKTG